MSACSLSAIVMKVAVSRLREVCLSVRARRCSGFIGENLELGLGRSVEIGAGVEEVVVIFKS